MTQGPFSVLLLESVNAVLVAEKILKEKGIPLKLIPVPRHLGTDCGVCIRLNAGDVDRALELLKEKVKVVSTHDLS